MNLKEPANIEKNIYSLKNASIKGYFYTKTYYRFDDNGEIIQSDNGNDNDLTIINIFKKENNDTEQIVTRKSVFGLEFFIKYIEEKSVQIKHGKLKQLFDKIWGNDAFKNQIAKEKKS